MRRIIPRAVHIDTFTRSDSETIGNGWIEHDQAGNHSLEITNNTLRYNGNLFTGGGGCYGRWTTAPANTDDQYIVTTTGFGGGSPSASTQLRLRATVDTTSTTVQLSCSPTSTSWSITALIDNVDVGGVSFTVSSTGGSTVRFEAVGNTYTAFRNGLQVGQWVDSGNVFTPGPTLRYSGVRLGTNGGNYQAWLNEFEFGDV